MPDDAWETPAAELEWTCRETAAHVLDDLVAYAMQVSGTRDRVGGYTPLTEFAPRADRPEMVFWFYPIESGGTAAMVDSLDAVGGVLAAVVATAPAERRGAHPYGDSDAAGFGAMGIVEALAHTFDIACARGLPFDPPGDVVAAVLDLIFPAADRTDDPWTDLLTATGRTPQTRGIQWRWDSRVP